MLTAVFRDTPPKRVVELTERKYARPTVSRTFEGRDRFAPAAGWLAKGIVLSSLGRAITDYRTIALAEPAIDHDAIRGEIVRVDRFGNLISNIDQRTLDRLTQQGAIVVSVNGREVQRLVAHLCRRRVRRTMRALRQHQSSRGCRQRRQCRRRFWA